MKRRAANDNGRGCRWQIAYGMPWTTYCKKLAKHGLYCAEHAKDHRDLYPHLYAEKRT